jgi:hypothetical protein
MTSEIFPTKHQHSIVIGHILGDGYLYKDGRLQVEQARSHEQYVLWLFDQLYSLVSGPISSVKRTHPKTKKESFSCRFYTKKIFLDLEAIFYRNSFGTKRKKIVPTNLETLLDPVVLAIWFLDDGGKAQNTPKAAYINATSFSEAERTQIQTAFLNVFNLKINIQKAGGNNQWNFYIPTNSYDRFYMLVYPTVSLIPSMMYKL